MEFVILACAGALCGWSAVFTWRRMPGGWLCDCGETETERHGAEERGLNDSRWPMFYAAVFALAAIRVYCPPEGMGAHGVRTADDIIGMGPVSSGAVGLDASGMDALGGAAGAGSGAAEVSAFLTAAVVLGALWCLLLITLADLRYMIIPDQLAAALAVLGLAGNILEAADGGLTFRHAAAAAAARGVFAGLLCAGLFWIVGKGAEAVVRAIGCGGEAFGFGDVKLLFAMGILLGLEGGLNALFAASLLSGAVSAVLLLLKKATAGGELPFGPWLCAAAAFQILWGA
ncbi:prepilin peptidase [Bacilliculturomica massiliensis]|uniref:prepilin peptidase n=1 Tax=Bacilliculturomica massiliensis TaxID=1917867 RepID=UPI00102FEC0C|nr:A24 family peptidase [Bacilliculturomica massiliensis]